jgi:hypothetical protein
MISSKEHSIHSRSVHDCRGTSNVESKSSSERLASVGGVIARGSARDTANHLHYEWTKSGLTMFLRGAL